MISPFVFPGRSLDKAFNGFGKVWLRIQTFTGLDGLTPHDFRHTFQTTTDWIAAALAGAVPRAGVKVAGAGSA
jgi:integrase